ncbi:hypothetical protein [Lutibacter citreus]|uniref:hypothetical protein n=1 Tax=Lutibacter citreus TaxID=2138210 RepID=UPI000DBE0CA6|nr:hypothetical protein [Lutibacter citreus]
MKKIILFTSLLLLIYSCNSSEENHTPKKVIREYIKEILHNPDSFEEVNWDFQINHKFTNKNPADINSPVIVDYNKTKKDDENGVVKFIELTYNAKSDDDTLKKDTLYAIYYENIQIVQFKNRTYSIKLNTYLPKDNSSINLNPKKMFLQNKYYFNNNGSGTYSGFLKKYPEFKDK